jgi:hypothetical protein
MHLLDRIRLRFLNPPATLPVTVTQEDIDKGVRSHPESCPIAQALRRQYGDSPSVGLYNFRLNDYRYSLPEEAQVFIMEFDSRWTVKPISFVAERSKQ